MNLRTFKHFLIYSRTFKALNFCFKIQGHLRTFKSCTNPDTPYSVAQRGGGNCPGPQTDIAPKSTIETKDNINVIDAVRRGGGGGFGPQLKILRRAAKIIWAAVHTCGNNSYSASMSSEMETLACFHAIKPCLRNSDHEWKISICCQFPGIISSRVCT